MLNVTKGRSKVEKLKGLRKPWRDRVKDRSRVVGGRNSKGSGGGGMPVSNRVLKPINGPCSAVIKELQRGGLQRRKTRGITPKFFSSPGDGPWQREGKNPMENLPGRIWGVSRAGP